MLQCRRIRGTGHLLSISGMLFWILPTAPLLALDPAAEPGRPASRKSHPTTALEAVSVVARGQTRQVQSISRVDLRQRLPGTSALKVLDELPGVQFQASDPFGAYEWSTQISLHGFDQSRLGFTLDGIPLGNMSYYLTDGLQVTRAISTENIASVELAQGAGALATASNSNLGGTIQYYSDDPDAKAGVRINQTLGSHATDRSAIRFDTGEHHGFSMYGSYVHTRTEKWKGYGAQTSDQINLKALYQWGNGNRISVFADASNRHEHDYMDLSKTSARVLGHRHDYLQPDWDTAVQMAQAYQRSGAYGGELNGYPAAFAALPADYDWLDVTYYAGGGIRRDDLTGLNGQFTLGDHHSLQVTIYDQSSKGEGQWVTPYVASPGTGVPLSMRTADFGLDRYGGLFDWTYDTGHNDIRLGVWIEQAHNSTERNYFNLAGAYTGLWNFYARESPFRRDFLQIYTMQTGMAYVQDTLHALADRLTINIGSKALYASTRAESRVPTAAYARGQMAAHGGFLPQLGIDYAIDGRQDIYASYSKNIHAYGLLPFSTSQAAFDASRSSLRPEASQTYALGYRSHVRSLELSADLYYTGFAHRLLATTPCSAIQTCASVLSNVGGIKSKGADLAVLWQLLHGLRWLNSFSYNSSSYQRDYLDGGWIATRGKHVVGIPGWMYASTLDLQLGRLSIHVDGKYTGQRYLSYVNDSSVAAYGLFNAGLRYDLGRVIHDVEHLSVGFNVYNLGHRHYFASVGTNGWMASDPNGYWQTLQAGAPRQFFFNIEWAF